MSRALRVTIGVLAGLGLLVLASSYFVSETLNDWFERDPYNPSAGHIADLGEFVRVFLGKEKPLLTFDDGLDVVRLLMTAYQSAEQGKTLSYPPRKIEQFVPAVARGTWKPASPSA